MNILNPAFKYVPACSTNIKERFDRIIAEQKAAAAKPTNVAPLKKVAK